MLCLIWAVKAVDFFGTKIDGGAMERIEFLGIRAEDSQQKAVIV